MSHSLPSTWHQGGVTCTINTRYDDMSMADIISLRHYPKTVILYEYEQNPR